MGIISIDTRTFATQNYLRKPLTDFLLKLISAECIRLKTAAFHSQINPNLSASYTPHKRERCL